MPRILIIDDEPTVRNAVAMVLRSRKWETDLADGGAAGLELARRNPPDLILCDLNMPSMTGLETLASIRRDPQLSSLPVVMLTGRAGDENEHQALRQGAQAVLLKPFGNEELLALMTRLLAPRPPA
jgi:two-component system, OmpR family, KDP operon response regulator KdpE